MVAKLSLILSIALIIHSTNTEFLEESYKTNLISAPNTFENWKGQIYLKANVFNNYNSYCTLAFTSQDPDYEYKYEGALQIYYGDWSAKIKFEPEDIIGGKLNSDKNGFNIPKGGGLVNVFFNKESLENLKGKKGIVFNGNGFTMTEVHIAGPRITKIEPSTLETSYKEQKLNIYFNEEASALDGNIKFSINELNDGIECKINKFNRKNIVCTGIFNKSGNVLLLDDADFTLFNQPIAIIEKEIVPEEEKQENITTDDDTTNFKELFNKETLIIDTGTVKFDESYTAEKIINEMGFGYNLGNTMDAYNLDGPKDHIVNEGLNSQYLWGQPKTREDMIEELKKKGFGAIRIPVTWHNHIIDDKYTIDPKWMTRIKEIVDWSINQGLYVILNIHHDNAELPSGEQIPYGMGYFPLNKYKEESERFIYNIWKQIVYAFNNGYGHRLIMEPFNEPRPRNTSCEWMYLKTDPLCTETVSVINEYLELATKIIRESGGNNAKRFLLIGTLGAQISGTLESDFQIPKDKWNTKTQKMIVSVHMYLPYDFTHNYNKKFNVFEDTDKNDIEAQFKQLYEKYILRGYSVIVGEMGSINKNNTEERTRWGKFMIETARKYHMATFMWDCRAKEEMGQFNRDKLSWYFDDLINTYVTAGRTTWDNVPSEIYATNFMKSSVTMQDWKYKISIDYLYFQSFNSFCKFVFTETDPPFNATSRSVQLWTGDWTKKLSFEKTDVIGAKAYGDSITILAGTNKVEIFLSKTNLDYLLNRKGMIFNGLGFTVTEAHVTGPRVTKIEPLKLSKSSSKQKVNIYFTEDASALNGKIQFKNTVDNLSSKINCNVLTSNKKKMICEGTFDKIGEFQILDYLEYTLFNNRFLTVKEE